MDLLVIPFHDWRKVQKEGARTRDAHLIQSLAKNEQVDRLVVINRPMSLTEMCYRGQSWKTEGVLIEQTVEARLVKVNQSLFAIDLFDPNPMGIVRQGKQWFFSAYAQLKNVEAIFSFQRSLNLENPLCISFNVYAARLFRTLDAEVKIFDAWDNFLKFPNYSKITDSLQDAYDLYAGVADQWTTNSQSNKLFFQEKYLLSDCQVIRNGADPKLFETAHEIPCDLKNIKRPIAGIGAKITHLLDTELLNSAIKSHPDVSFVLIGQKLEPHILKNIYRAPNFHYLGDKPYGVYPAYVSAFDIALIPYVTGEHEHGGDSIKFYEYVAARKPIVTTNIEGTSDSHGRVFIANNRQEFIQAIPLALKSRVTSGLPKEFTWDYRTEQFLNLLGARKQYAAS